MPSFSAARSALCICTRKGLRVVNDLAVGAQTDNDSQQIFETPEQDCRGAGSPAAAKADC